MEQIKLLLADDERIERSILYRKLSRELGEECEFIQAENGSEAVELFKEHHPQIAVLDIAMPELDGIEAASRIRQMDENCVIIFLTAYSDFQYTRQAIRLRALDYLTKPYDEEELFAVLETAVFQVKKRMEAENRMRKTGWLEVCQSRANPELRCQKRVLWKKRVILCWNWIWMIFRRIQVP